jgi:hypothetical protein
MSSRPFAKVLGWLWISSLHLVLVDNPGKEGVRFRVCEDDEFDMCEVKREGSSDHSLLEVSGRQARLWVTDVIMQVLPCSSSFFSTTTRLRL